MPEDVAVLDAPTEDVTPIEAGSPEVSTTPEATVEDTSTETTDDSAQELSGSALWREFKANIDGNKPLTPAQIKGIRDAIHFQQSQTSKYPEGLGPLESAKEQLGRLSDDPTMPVEQVIESTLQERDYFRELDSLYTNGDPNFANKLAEAEPNAFQQLAPSVFRKFAELNPEGYSAYIANAVSQHMNSMEIPLNFRILQTFLPQVPDSPAKDQVIQAFNQVLGWSQQIQALASKPVAPKDFKPQAQEQTQQQNAPDRELDLNRREWNLENKPATVSFIATEAKKAAGKTVLTEKENESVLAKVREELEARLSVDKRFADAMQGYLRNGNKTAYVQRQASENKKLIPGAVRRAVDDVIAARPKAAPKPAAQAQRQPNGQFQGKPQPASPQFRRIAGHPKTQGLMVDLNRTTQSMLLRKQAFVKGDNQPVSWQ